MFRRILVANRGEIALRVIRTAREMGIETVAVYSEFDRLALHTRLADRAVSLGGSVPSESYLVGEKILAAARETGAEAIHPGYGFLAENAAFAQAVVDAGLVWIGPPSEAIAVMGDKIESRRAMQAAGVPVVPGLVDSLDDAQAAVAAAEEIGYPIALKAAAGGGGKGIRIVHRSSEMEVAFRTASGEAASAFGDGRLYMERYLERARHVEIQVLFDHHGGAVHFGERECSIQRRHQKLIEECPAVVVDQDLRERMGAVALQAGHAVDYQGAGTVEFLFCGGEFFFLEMNTRLQVEHPVTEMITGIDLVREQIRIADGKKLSFSQEDVILVGHAIECRINAEHPETFMPSPGTITEFHAPGGPDVRVDSAAYAGYRIPPHYDSMIGKLIVHGRTRNECVMRLRRALDEMVIGGVQTTLPLHQRLVEAKDVVDGNYDIHWLERFLAKS
jgi:acetyl-CoA carboxylase biotin carboxylase subunit